MKLFSFVSLACALPALAFGTLSLRAAEKPNIILILADDMGWGDLSLNSKGVNAKHKPATPVIRTPKLAAMAQQGIQLRRHYTAAPVCAPARASLFSGVHQGHAEVIRNNSFDAALENSHTLASVLREAGYATALIGKWGIGGGKERGGTPDTAAGWPTKRGFDYFFGYHNHIAGHRHYPKEESNVDPDTHTNAVWDGNENITPQLDSCYSTDLFTARAKKWIVDQRKAAPDRPFFLALTLIAPHARLAVPSTPYPKGGGLKGGVQWLGTPGKMINTAEGAWDTYIYPAYRNNKAWQKYAEQRFGSKGAPAALQAAERHATMVTRVDDAVGDLLQLLRDLKIDKNTVIVFTSDNGPHNEPGAVAGIADHPAPRQNPAFFRSYGPLDGIKRDVWEGGLRVPCVVYAPMFTGKEHISDSPCQFQDWMATFADMAGVPKPMRCDGVSLLPALRGAQGAPRGGIIYAEYNFGGGMADYPDFAPNKKGRARGEQQMIYFYSPDAEGRFMKGIRTDIKTGQEDFEIYDVTADSHESHNLAAQYTAAVQDWLRTRVLYNRRAYDYTHDDAAGERGNPCDGRRCYDNVPVPAAHDTPARCEAGLQMRRAVTPCPWVPEFDTLRAEKSAPQAVADPAAEELPAGSVTEFAGFLDVPDDGQQWHFFLTLDAVAGSKAYIKMHNFQLIDADMNYTPGSTATESAAANTQERVEVATGKRGIPLQAGLHEIIITVVQGAAASGHLKLEWQNGSGPRVAIPAKRYFHNATPIPEPQ